MLRVSRHTHMRSKLAPKDPPSLQELDQMLDRALCDDPMELVRLRAAEVCHYRIEEPADFPFALIIPPFEDLESHKDSMSVYEWEEFAENVIPLITSAGIVFFLL